MAVITISRQFGAGGTTLGARLLKRPNFRYVNDEPIREVARNAGAPSREVQCFEKKDISNRAIP